jgi:hypothetical protein
MNTLNPVIQIIAHMDFKRARVAFLPVAGRSLDALSEPVVHSTLTGETIPPGDLSIMQVLQSIEEGGYRGADYSLLAWDAAKTLDALRSTLPELCALIGDRVIDMRGVRLALESLPSALPYAVERPESALALVDAVREVHELYQEVVLYLVAAQNDAGVRGAAPSVGVGSGVVSVVGVGGRKGHGKDTFAGLLGEDWVVIGMSDPLYEAVLKLNPLVELVSSPGTCIPLSVYLDSFCGGDWTEAKKNPGVRVLLQRLGTDVVRDMVDEDAWVDIMRFRVRCLLNEGKKVVVTGVRFPNELEAIKRLGGKTVWVERPGVGDGDSHISEAAVAMQSFDFVVNNSGTIEDLGRAARRVADVVSG